MKSVLSRISRSYYVLGIESSCDDSCISVLSSRREIKTELVSSQWEILRKYGGVVPSLSAREHEKILPLLLKEARIDEIMDEIKLIGVTVGPGLSPCLKVGYSIGKELSEKHKKELMPINHLEGHILVSKLDNAELEFPYLNLLLSGGHSQIILSHNINDHTIIGDCLDDSLGEAYDKVAKLLNIIPEEINCHLGKLIEEESKKGNNKKYQFPVPLIKRKSSDFSYSGLKSSISRMTMKMTKEEIELNKSDICACFERSVFKSILRSLTTGINMCGEKLNALNCVGGVLRNENLRNILIEYCKKINLPIFFPKINHCSDNATMIAFTSLLYKENHINHPNLSGFDPNWNLFKQIEK